MRIRAPPKKKDQGRKRIKRKGEGAGWGYAEQAQLPFSWKPSKQIKKNPVPGKLHGIFCKRD